MRGTSGLRAPRVNILLSTFNGARYIREQLDSLFAQDYRPFRLIARDDGSADGTAAVLQAYAGRHPGVELEIGRRLGVAASFVTLLRNCQGRPGDYYAFCDQDDIWVPDKLSRAVAQLSTAARPSATLYCSRLQYVDARLRPLGLSALPRHIGFCNAVVENIAIGCTCVFGSDIRDRVAVADPNDMMMHDWWAYLVATAFGDVVYDGAPTILYRQHGANTAGWERRGRKVWNRARGLARRLLRGNEGLDSINQAQRFVRTYPDLPERERALLQRLVGLRSATAAQRLRYALRPEVMRNDRLEDLLLRPLILFGLH